MAKSKTLRANRRKPATLMHYKRGKGLMISTEASRPTSIADKITCAKSVMQAVRAAHDAQSLEGENYDIGWPLGLAIDLLEEASQELSEAETREARS